MNKGDIEEFRQSLQVIPDYPEGEPPVRVQRVVGGIIIPERPPASIVEALNNFVAAVYAYEETGVWPDNQTIRRLAEEGREALGHRYSPNEKGQR